MLKFEVFRKHVAAYLSNAAPKRDRRATDIVDLAAWIGRLSAQRVAPYPAFGALRP
jgi:hypothetical protein